jgi:hypothetical protein
MNNATKIADENPWRAIVPRTHFAHKVGFARFEARFDPFLTGETGRPGN